MPERVGWQECALWALRQAGGREVRRAEIVDVVMTALGDAHSCRDPEQAVSLALQRLRDKGRVRFLGRGTYRLVDPGETLSAGCEPASAQQTGDKVMVAEKDRGLRIVTEPDGIVRSVEPVESPAAGRDLPPEPPKPPVDDRGSAPQPGDFGQLVFLPAAVLSCDEYQRAESEAWAERKAKSFVWRLIDPLTVNHRADGSYYVIDGQHRTMLLKRTGNGSVPVPVYLFERLTPDQEAARFVDGQRPGARRSLSALDIFWAEHFRNDDEAMGINRAVIAAGGRIARSAQQQWEGGGTIRALAQLRRAYRLLGEKGLRDSLTVLRDTWGLGGLATSGVHILGMALVWLHYGAQIDRASFVEKLQKKTPQTFLGEAIPLATSAALEGRAYGMALALVRQYNLSRSVHRLPLTPLMTAADKRERSGARNEKAWRRYTAGDQKAGA